MLFHTSRFSSAGAVDVPLRIYFTVPFGFADYTFSLYLSEITLTIERTQKRDIHTEERVIRLIASDIDGTLVPEGTGAINPEYFEVIKKLKDRGIRFAAVSGRNYNSVAKLFAPVLDDIYLILENGGWILEGSRTLFTRTFQRETVCGITAAFIMCCMGRCRHLKV